MVTAALDCSVQNHHLQTSHWPLSLLSKIPSPPPPNIIQILNPFCLPVIIDLRIQKIVTRVAAHTTAVNSIVINDTDGYFVSGSADGDIKVICASGSL